MPGLVERITHLADQYEIERKYLHLEITESVYTDEPQQIIQMVNKLRENGFKIEMDDFGSGYSSLNMLSELSVDVIAKEEEILKICSGEKYSILIVDDNEMNRELLMLSVEKVIGK